MIGLRTIDLDYVMILYDSFMTSAVGTQADIGSLFDFIDVSVISLDRICIFVDEIVRADAQTDEECVKIHLDLLYCVINFKYKRDPFSFRKCKNLINTAGRALQTLPV